MCVAFLRKGPKKKSNKNDESFWISVKSRKKFKPFVQEYFSVGVSLL